jgi:hypothetical protein
MRMSQAEDYELRDCAKEGKKTLHKVYNGEGCKAYRCVPCALKAAEFTQALLRESYGTNLTRNA